MFGSSKHKLHHTDGYEFIKISGDAKLTHDIVLIHGMFGGLSNFDPLIEFLEGYSIYVPNIPLYDFKKSQLTIPAMAEWLEGFMTTLNISCPILLGNSMGGHIALEFARSLPSRTRALILTGSSGLLEYDFGSSFPRRKSREYIKERANMTFYEDLADEAIVEELLEVINSRKKLLNLLKLTRSTHAYNMEKILPKIIQPALLVWGKQDIITPPKVALQFQSLLPNSRLEWIDQCGHAPMLERPVQFANLMNDFLFKIEQNNRSKQKII